MKKAAATDRAEKLGWGSPAMAAAPFWDRTGLKGKASPS